MGKELEQNQNTSEKMSMERNYGEGLRRNGANDRKNEERVSCKWSTNQQSGCGHEIRDKDKELKETKRRDCRVHTNKELTRVESCIGKIVDAIIRVRRGIIQNHPPTRGIDI